MSTTGVAPLRARIVAKIEELGQVSAREIDRYFEGVDRGALDVGLNSLERDGQVERNGVWLSLARTVASSVPRQASEMPPAAEEEAAASLSPRTGLVVERICNECRTPRPIAEFRLLNADSGRRAKTCDFCHALKKLQRQEKAGQSGDPDPIHCDIAQSVERLPVKEDVPGSSPGVAAISVHVDLVPLIRQRRQEIAKQIELARVALDNLVNKQLEYDRFLELHERLSREVA